MSSARSRSGPAATPATPVARSSPTRSSSWSTATRPSSSSPARCRRCPPPSRPPSAARPDPGSPDLGRLAGPDGLVDELGELGLCVCARALHLIAEALHLLAERLHLLAELLHLLAELLHLVLERLLLPVGDGMLHLPAQLSHALAERLHLLAQGVHAGAQRVHLLPELVHRGPQAGQARQDGRLPHDPDLAAALHPEQLLVVFPQCLRRLEVIYRAAHRGLAPRLEPDVGVDLGRLVGEGDERAEDEEEGDGLAHGRM